ncbi:MAG: hypothetical protein WDZ28_04630 [Simkaniaceae bacterium]
MFEGLNNSISDLFSKAGPAAGELLTPMFDAASTQPVLIVVATVIILFFLALLILFAILYLIDAAIKQMCFSKANVPVKKNALLVHNNKKNNKPSIMHKEKSNLNQGLWIAS